MKLKELLKGIHVIKCTADLETEIGSVAYDSRKVQPGGAFVAISGFTSDGNRFIPMAMEKGAAVVVTAKKPNMDVPYVLVDNDRLALALLGTNFYGHPAEAMTMIGITMGTDGCIGFDMSGHDDLRGGRILDLDEATGTFETRFLPLTEIMGRNAWKNPDNFEGGWNTDYFIRKPKSR